MSDDETWRIFDDEDDSDSVFEGFTAADLVKVREYESDLDIDFDNIEFSPVSTPDMSSDEEDLEAAEVVGERAWSKHLTAISTDPFSEDVGAKHNLPVGSEPIDFFNLLIPEAFLATIAEQTNIYAEEKQSEKRDPQWFPVTVEEVKLFLAIGIMMGIHKLPRQKLYWSKDDRLNVPAISKLMSQNRYMKLLQYLHLNDNRNFIPRGMPGFDPLFKIRPLIECTSHSFKEHFKPNRELSIDEAMIRYNGRLHFKQYIRAKPSPWGIKVWCCADPRTGYLLTYDVYTGKTQHTAKGKFCFLFLYS